MEYKKMDIYIGNELYKARVVKRITQEQITDSINKKIAQYDMSITRQSYSNYEHGTFSMPQGVLEACCDILGLDWRKIFNEAVEYMQKEVGSK